MTYDYILFLFNFKHFHRMIFTRGDVDVVRFVLRYVVLLLLDE